MRPAVTPRYGPASSSSHPPDGASAVTLAVIGELDREAIPGLEQAVASLNGGDRAVRLDLSKATFSDGWASRERLRPVLKLRLLGRDRAEIEVDGRLLQLSRRHTEVIALLAARPGGMTSDELAVELYGDAAHRSTARVEVCRLRKLLGDWIDTEPYRLCVDVECDVEQIQGLLEQGAVREAADRYEGKLLPHSEAPGVVRQRDGLDGWMRHAVMSADDGAALWAWLRSPSGCDDLAAWKRLLARLKFHDPRRSLAAARLRTLREA